MDPVAPYIAENAQAYRSYLQEHFATLWSQTASSVAACPDGVPPTLWTCYAASFLLRVGALRCAIDLSFKHAPIDRASLCLERTLPQLDLFLLTHLHGDHYDPQTIHLVARQDDALFVIPSPLVDRVRAECGLDPKRILPIADRETVRFAGLAIQAFRTRHVNLENSFGYVLDTGNAVVVLPSDIRDYATDELPETRSADWLIFNVWLGRRRALNVNPAQVEAACQFIAHFDPRNVLLSHLYEVSRTPEDMWTFVHAGLVQDRLLTLLPHARCHVPYPGDPVRLTSL